jgi:hypothetical protein
MYSQHFAYKYWPYSAANSSLSLSSTTANSHSSAYITFANMRFSFTAFALFAAMAAADMCGYFHEDP